MRIALKLIPIVAAAAVLAGTASPAQARFTQPYEIAKEPAVKAAAEKLKGMKEPMDAEGIFKEMQTAAAAGSVEAQFLVGFLYHAGLGTERSNDKAKEAYQKAVAAGMPAAKNNLGLVQLASGDDPKKAIDIVEEAANGGYSPAQVSMGQLFLDGLPAAGIAKDVDQARMWFERASEAGDDEASLTLGMMYEKGTGVTADQEKSAALLQKAAEKGNTDAMIRLGAKLVAGQGIKADPDKGKGWFEKAIAAGAAGAKVALASIYETGTGVAKDEKKAFELYTESTAAGDLSAYNKIGYFHEKGIGVAKDETKAAEWYKKGADKNVPVCIHNLAIFHEEGKGGVKKDEAEAFNLFYKASMNAFVPSQLALAVRYREGRGVMQDTQAALAWFERGMQNGNLDASVSYASMLESGEAGFVNLETALKVYREVASKGHPGAMVALGAMLENGRGLPGDFRQAYMLYLYASKGGYKVAEDRLEKLKGRMTPEQIKVAEAFVASGGRDTGSSPGPLAPPPASAPQGKPVTTDTKKDDPAKKPSVPPVKPKPPKTARPR